MFLSIIFKKAKGSLTYCWYPVVLKKPQNNKPIKSIETLILKAELLTVYNYPSLLEGLNFCSQNQRHLKLLDTLRTS